MSIKPFTLAIYGEKEEKASLMLTDFSKDYLFQERADEGWEGGGYGWEALVRVLLNEQLSEFKHQISFDSEASMFVTYGQREAIQKFGEKLALLYQDDSSLRDAFSRAELN